MAVTAFTEEETGLERLRNFLGPEFEPVLSYLKAGALNHPED